jgi:hypothetical protein
MQEKELKGILKSLVKINASLGTVVTADLIGDVSAVITDEAALNVSVDLAKTFLGADGTDSIAELVVLLEAVLEGIP